MRFFPDLTYNDLMSENVYFGYRSRKFIIPHLKPFHDINHCRDIFYQAAIVTKEIEFIVI